MPEHSFQRHLTTRYGAAHAGVVDADATRRVLLHIDAEQTGVVVGRGSVPDATLARTIGAQKTAREFFKHTPPSQLELENAIAMVEDETTRARLLIPAGAPLCTMDAAIRDIARLSGISPADTMHLSLDAMERTFDRLAKVSLGRPASSEGLPASNSFAATLLILREFMHHLQFSDITVVAIQTE